MMRHRSALSLAIAALAACAAARAGDIYCDNQGRDCSDRPSPNSTVVHVKAPPASASNETAPAPDNARKPVDASANAQLKDDASRQAVQKDVAAKRADDCKNAREKYQQSIQAHRIYKLNKAGEREYLSDSELDQARLNSRLEMDRTCGTSGN
jgi:predicted lipid-binding transport protein (Tim44 family)